MTAVVADVFLLRLRLRRPLLLFFLGDELRMLEFDVLVEAPLAPVGFLAGGDSASVESADLVGGPSVPLILLLSLATIVIVLLLIGIHNTSS